MTCPGLIVVLLAAGPGSPPRARAADAAARARSREAVDRGERGGSAQRPRRAIGQGGRSSGRRAGSRADAPDRSIRMARRVSFRSPKWSRLARRKRGAEPWRASLRKSSRDRPRSSSSSPSVPPRPIPRLTRWRACACVPSSNASPTIGRRGGCWATCRMRGAGPGRSPSASSQGLW